MAFLITALILPEYSLWLIGVVVLFMVGAGPLGQRFLWFLSRRYPQLEVDVLPQDEYLIAVAGSGFQQHSRRVPESWFGDNLVIRLTEAGRVAHELQKRNIPYKICISMSEFLGMKQDSQTGLI